MLSSVALAVGCGHLAFIDLPSDEDGTLPDGSVDSGGSGSRDGGGSVDAQTDVRDAGCAPPSCPGVYVSSLTGDDSHPGTPEKPVRTIKEGSRRSGGGQTVYVAQGDYEEKVTLRPGISLLGGYSCARQPCTWERSTLQYETVIWNADAEGVVAPLGVARATLFEGFKVHAFDTPTSSLPGNVALTLDRGSPTVRDCRLLGADLNGLAETRRSIGIAVLGTPAVSEGALIENNSIQAGTGSWSVGIMFDAARSGTPGIATAVVRKNFVRSGAANVSIGIMTSANARSAQIIENDINAGPTSGNEPMSWGILSRSTMTIDRNIVNSERTGACSPSGVWCGGIALTTGTSTVTNNAVFGARSPKSTALLLSNEDGSNSLTVVNANTFDGAGLGLDGSVASTAIVLRATNAGNGVLAGRIRNNILLGGTNKARYGVYEESNGVVHTSALENNDFWNPPESSPRSDYAYRRWDGSNATDLVFTALTANNNINEDPKLGPGQHLLAGSPCIDKGTNTEAPPLDFDGDPRPKAGTKVDIGADETK